MPEVDKGKAMVMVTVMMTKTAKMVTNMVEEARELSALCSKPPRAA
jgi:hypothetical protein